MLIIDQTGKAVHSNIKQAISVAIQRRPMTHVRGIIVHQTDSPSAQSTLNSYKNGRSGAHFLIAKDGTIYQTASLLNQTWHVGRLRARCLVKMTCSPVELKLLRQFDPKAEHRREMSKHVPDRYPSNEDSIGIELVGEALPRNAPDDQRVYEAVTARQAKSLKWLILELRTTFGVPVTEVFRHPTVSRKNPSEAATATW
ncbi:peptidoglycan recognition protein family protein [Nitrogeniibacter mangrovi]|nr:peptidoglycan recognition family protein [Nitrogeniibacter mangrovi]